MKNYFDIYLFIIIVAILILKIFYFNNQYILHDELVNLTTYYYKETIFLKNFPNNHLYISFLGMIFEYIFGTNLLFLRLINFLAFLLILYFANKILRNKLKLYLIFLIFLISDILFTYSFVLRGYYISSLLFVVIFFLILNLEEKRDFKNFNWIFLICCFQILNNISALYLVVPIISSILLNYKNLSIKNKIKSFQLYFLFPLIFFSSLQIFVTGLYIYKIYTINTSSLNFILNNFFEFFRNSVNTIYFSSYTSSNLYENLNNLYNQVIINPEIFLIIFLCIIISLINIYKSKKSLINYIVIYFFIFFILINKFPPTRVYLGFYYFFLIYLFYNIGFKKLKITYLNYFIILISLITILTIKDTHRNFATIKDNQINLEKKLICKLKNNNFKEIEKHMYYYLFLERCDKKRNLNDFLNFYKSK